MVDLGHVGVPVHGSSTLLGTLCRGGWVPTVASLGVTQEGEPLNVNADVAASHLAVSVGAARLLVLGATDGVYDAGGRTIAALSEEDITLLIQSGAARDGMAAKLRACAQASAKGVPEVRILHGRSASLSSGGTQIACAATGSHVNERAS
jgi:acetylglutamate kinase